MLCRDLLGATHIGEPLDLPAQKVRVCFVDAPNSQIELLEPIGADSPFAKFLDRNPLGGQHHACYEVPDLHAATAGFESRGVKLLGEPRIAARAGEYEQRFANPFVPRA